MATIDTTAATQGRRGFSRTKKHSVRIDMTPMVDLGFLLITFFIFTSRMSDPVATPLNMPKDDGISEMDISDAGAITMVMGASGQVWYYEGKLLDDGSNIRKSNSGDIRQVLIDKKKAVIALAANSKALAASEEEARTNNSNVDDCRQQKMFVVIKALPDADYDQVVNVLDEMAINKINRYALVNITSKETGLLSSL